MNSPASSVVLALTWILLIVGPAQGLEPVRRFGGPAVGVAKSYGPSTFSSSATPVAVLSTNADEVTPAAEGEYLAWAQNRPTARNQYNAYVRPRGEPRIRLNADGSKGVMGGIDGDQLAFQQFRGDFGAWVARGQGSSSIRLFDLPSRQFSALPGAVNTAAWEFHPFIDGNWLLFGRVGGSRARVILFNLVTGSSRILADVAVRDRDVFPDPGRVNGNFAVFDKCNARGTRCDAFIHNISGNTTSKIPNPGAPWQYEPSVLADGTVYFWRSGPSCRARTRLMRRTPAGVEIVLVTFPRGWDTSSTYGVDETSVRVLYEKWNACGPGDSDIFEVAG